MPIPRHLRAARASSSDEVGFTLIELLVVMVIIGILAAVAIPLFFSQTQKATDGSAKALARSAQTATEAYSTDHNGSYTGLSVAELRAAEPVLNQKTPAELLVAEPLGGGKGYLVEVKNVASGDTFGIERNLSGEVARTCAPEKKGGCAAGGVW